MSFLRCCESNVFAGQEDIPKISPILPPSSPLFSIWLAILGTLTMFFCSKLEYEGLEYGELFSFEGVLLFCVDEKRKQRTVFFNFLFGTGILFKLGFKS